jgi:hypothetical protein
MGGFDVLVAFVSRRSSKFADRIFVLGSRYCTHPQAPSPGIHKELGLRNSGSTAMSGLAGQRRLRFDKSRCPISDRVRARLDLFGPWVFRHSRGAMCSCRRPCSTPAQLLHSRGARSFGNSHARSNFRTGAITYVQSLASHICLQSVHRGVHLLRGARVECMHAVID